MSPGNLYRYFPSKEAIIAGIVEQNQAEAAANFANVAASTDFWSTFAALAHRYMVEQSEEEVGLCAEIASESRRNPAVAQIMLACDGEIKNKLINLLRGAAERGDINRDADLENIVTLLMVIADGVGWRRVSDPTFDPETVLPLVLSVTRHMLTTGVSDKSPKQEFSS